MAVSAAVAGAVIAGGSLAYSMDQGRKAEHAREDMTRDAKLIDTKAAQTANSRIAMRRRALEKNSLITGGGGDMATTGLDTGGRATLGGA